MRKPTIDRLRALSDEDRITRQAGDWIIDLADPEGVRELADALTVLADTIEQAAQDVDMWVEAEGREDKADAREAAIGSVQSLVEAWDAIDWMEIPDDVKALIAGAGTPEDA